MNVFCSTLYADTDTLVPHWDNHSCLHMTVYSTHHFSTFCTVVNVAGQTGGLLNKLSLNLHYHAVSVLENVSVMAGCPSTIQSEWLNRTLLCLLLKFGTSPWTWVWSETRWWYAFRTKWKASGMKFAVAKHLIHNNNRSSGFEDDSIFFSLHSVGHLFDETANLKWMLRRIVCTFIDSSKHERCSSWMCPLES
jgi:hypothetical protein